LRRWYWTVRGLMKSRLPISGFDRLSRASRAICVSCAVSWLLDSTGLRGRSRRWPAARARRARRTLPCPSR
jgi:hypothetical protein